MPVRPAARTVRRAAALAATAGVVAALAACSPGGGSGATERPSAPLSSTADVYPLTLDNCGTKVTIDRAPQRVVTIKSTSTEMLLALGLQDRIVGTAFSDGPVPDEWADAAADLTVVSDNVPGREAVLALQPDLVYGGWESNFSDDGAGDRAALQADGIATYVSPAACKEKGYQPDPLTFDALFDQIREVATIFDVPERAETLISKQRAELDSVRPPAQPTTALWYSSGTDQPYVGAGIGAPQMVMDAVGLTNVFAAVHDTWTSTGWEQVVAADPDVIVLVDATWNTADSKIALLEQNAATRQLRAVREHRYLRLPFPAGEAGVRSASAVVELSHQLEALDGD